MRQGYVASACMQHRMVLWRSCRRAASAAVMALIVALMGGSSWGLAGHLLQLQLASVRDDCVVQPGRGDPVETYLQRARVFLLGGNKGASSCTLELSVTSSSEQSSSNVAASYLHLRLCVCP
jgi:hypothetical protein